MNTDCCAYIRLLYLLKRDEKSYILSTVCVVYEGWVFVSEDLKDIT